MLSYRVTTTGECFRQRMSEERHSAVKMCLCNSAMRVQKEVNIYIITICMIIFGVFVQHQSTYGRCCLLLPAHLSFQRRSSGFDLLQTGRTLISISCEVRASGLLLAGGGMELRAGLLTGLLTGLLMGLLAAPVFPDRAVWVDVTDEMESVRPNEEVRPGAPRELHRGTPAAEPMELLL